MTRTRTPCNASSSRSPGPTESAAVPGALLAGASLSFWLAAACAHAPAPAGGPFQWTVPGDRLGKQYLFRVAVDASRGAGSGRLVLILADRERYQLRAADTLGRALWSFASEPPGWVLMDARAERYCRGPGKPTLPDLDLGVLAPVSLPAVLLGFLPEPPEVADPAASALDWHDGSGRRWTVRGSEARAIAWTLWEGGRPLVWWTREGDGGILSHRSGVQVRWRQVTSEPLPGPVAALVPPAGYHETTCDELHLPELREDQPPPPGGGPAR